MGNKENNSDIATIREVFRESNLPFAVDIFYWQDIPDSFKSEINSHKLKIYGE